MKLKKLIDDFKMCRGNRKKWRIRWKIEGIVDSYETVFFLLPTIMFQPWVYRYPCTYVIDITWMCWHIGIGKWVHKQMED